MFQLGILVFWFLLNLFELKAQRQISYQQPSSACANFFSYQSDQNEKFAIVTLPNPDRVRNVLKIQMSLGVHVTMVSMKFYLKN
jgi:hypothetical protein